MHQVLTDTTQTVSGSCVHIQTLIEQQEVNSGLLLQSTTEKIGQNSM